MLPAIQTLLLLLLLLRSSFSPETNFKTNCSAAPCKDPAANPSSSLLCSHKGGAAWHTLRGFRCSPAEQRAAKAICSAACSLLPFPDWTTGACSSRGKRACAPAWCNCWSTELNSRRKEIQAQKSLHPLCL